MVQSMTGYGQAIGQLGEQQVSIEVKTVNHRFLDCSLKMPNELLPLEETLKARIKNWFERGRVDVWIQINGEALSEQSIRVNWPLLNQYLEQIHNIQDKTHVSGDVTIDHLLQLDGLFEKDQTTHIDDQLEDVVLNTLDDALKSVADMRRDEGEKLKRDVLHYNADIKRLAKELDDNQETLKEHYYERVLNRMQDALRDVSIDEQRLVQEVAFLVDKGDISEEVTRLLSHVDQVDELLVSNEAIGRRLDFLTQELHREANTIGSKANDVALSKQAVALKSVIEKIKEQVQNIE
ncbi:uncharacterized protein (TIGR00255 family) [Alkalibacillus flavidus]|uniref:Uncharacterized protein (TIGR00255 family) n=1 Tax=Alkalibacillus flavidus TaxID=546021 RepID=A0ABV2KR67_9BACI